MRKKLLSDPNYQADIKQAVAALIASGSIGLPAPANQVLLRRAMRSEGKRQANKITENAPKGLPGGMDGV